MPKAVLAMVALLAFAVPAATVAEETPAAEHGIQLKLGLGAGFGIPFGEVRKDVKLADLYAGEIPIELEASYRFTHAISAGVYAGYAYGLVSSNEVEGVKASDALSSIQTLRLGVQGEYELAKVGPAFPYATVRVGYVAETLKSRTGADAKASGWEYFTLVGGADFEVAERFAVGPFVSFSLGQYTTEKSSGEASQSIPSSERALHEWLTIGVRGSFAL
jgi:hypothetical protein